MKRTLSATIAYLEQCNLANDNLITAWWSQGDIMLALENEDIPEHMHEWAEENAIRLWNEFTENEDLYEWALDRAYEAMRESIADYLKDAYKGENE